MAGNVYLGGDFGNGDLNSPVLTRIGNQDAFALKLNAVGTVLWAQNFGGAGVSTEGNGLAVDGTGNIYLGGSFRNANLTSPPLSLAGSQTGFILKQPPVSNGPPVANTGVAVGITPTGTTLTGKVADYGVAVTAIAFDYGPTTSYGSTQVGSPASVAAGSGSTSVNGTVAGLTCNTLYHYRLHATYAGGTVHGSDATFTTTGCVSGPSVSTDAATAIARTSATLNGTVSDVGRNVTSIAFDYGLTTAYGAASAASITTITARPGLPTTVAPLANLTGLACGTTYHFRIRATDAITSTAGNDQTFATLSCTSQAITFGSAPSVVVGGTGTVSAAASSGLPVSFASVTPAVCTISGSTVSGTSAGTCTIAADQAGNANYAAAPQVLHSFTIGKAGSTVTLGSSINPSVDGHLCDVHCDDYGQSHPPGR